MASHMQVAHRWATGLDMHGDEYAKGLKGFNMFSDGRSIYSYGRHFEIARIVPDASGRRVVLFTRDSRSVSTSKHKTYTMRAIGYGDRRPVFHVVDFHGDHAANLAAFEADAQRSHGAAGRARTHVQMHLDAAERSLAEAGRYAAAFDVPWTRPTFADLSERAAAAAKAQREANERSRLATIEAERIARIEGAEAFARWQSGKHPGASVPYGYRQTPTGGAYLRRYGDELQTSQHAAVPWEHALKAFRFVKLIRERGEGFKSNGRKVRVGHYQIDEIDADGSFRAGCHTIQWDQIEALAQREGVFDVAPSDAAVTVEAH